VSPLARGVHTPLFFFSAPVHHLLVESDCGHLRLPPDRRIPLARPPLTFHSLACSLNRYIVLPPAFPFSISPSFFREEASSPNQESFFLPPRPIVQKDPKSIFLSVRLPVYNSRPSSPLRPRTYKKPRLGVPSSNPSLLGTTCVEFPAVSSFRLPSSQFEILTHDASPIHDPPVPLRAFPSPLTWGRFAIDELDDLAAGFPFPTPLSGHYPRHARTLEMVPSLSRAFCPPRAPLSSRLRPPPRCIGHTPGFSSPVPPRLEPKTDKMYSLPGLRDFCSFSPFSLSFLRL